jgi:N-acetylglucosamine-6-sulfatase
MVQRGAGVIWEESLGMDIEPAAVRTRTLAMALAALAPLAAIAAPAALARPVGAATDGRPNILVVMTDDMASTDLQFMPNTRRLLARQGTKFADAVDSFPLCCPARATFITGQYAHNHDVGATSTPTAGTG